jgi:hypothetical protein
MKKLAAIYERKGQLFVTASHKTAAGFGSTMSKWLASASLRMMSWVAPSNRLWLDRRKASRRRRPMHASTSHCWRPPAFVRGPRS